MIVEQNIKLNKAESMNFYNLMRNLARGEIHMVTGKDFKWPRIEGSMKLERLEQIEDPKILEDLYGVRTMLLAEEYAPDEFFLCEYPAEKVYCFDKGDGTSYFMIGVDDDDELVPMYRTKEFDEHGCNVFFCDQIHKAIKWMEM